MRGSRSQPSQLSMSLGGCLARGREGVSVLVEQVKVKYQVQEKSCWREERSVMVWKSLHDCLFGARWPGKARPITLSAVPRQDYMYSVLSTASPAVRHTQLSIGIRALLPGLCSCAVRTSKFACNLMSLRDVLLVVVVQSDITIDTYTALTATCTIEDFLCA
jgi:hypothetical protein